MPGPEVSTVRLEAFSDGVIAVIITIMVLELHVPQTHGLPGLVHVLPRLAIYALSFLMTGVYWVNHHELCRRTESVTYRVLWANLLFLFTLSLVPFFTDYVAEQGFDSFSTALYDAVLILAGQGFLAFRLSLNAMYRLHGQSLPKQDRAETFKHYASIATFLLALPMAYVKPVLSLLMNFAVTLLWVVPELATHRPRECDGSGRA